jgi:RNA polymerase sigma-70 factor (ECF subfamily)
MIQNPGDGSLVRRWCAGEQQAAQQIFDRYVERLLGLAKRRLNERLARRVDPEDIVQSVFRTFFARVQADFFSIQDPDDLCKLLVRITLHKTLKQVAYHQAAKRHPDREQFPRENHQDPLMQLMDREPGPEEASAFLDELEHFLERLRPVERRIVELRLQGYGTDEIARILGIYDRKVRRVTERIRGLAESIRDHGT